MYLTFALYGDDKNYSSISENYWVGTVTLRNLLVGQSRATEHM